MVIAAGTYHATVGTQEIDLPLIPITDDLAIALLITVDHGVRFVEQAATELAEQLEKFDLDLVVSVATMGIPLAIEVTRALGLDDYLILQKTPKLHLRDAITEPVKSITTGTQQRLLFDAARVEVVKGRRVGVVDDVISTGASMRAALNLLYRVGAKPVAIGTLVTEAATWRRELADTVDLVHALGAIPVFRRDSSGVFVEDWDGGGEPDGLALAPLEQNPPPARPEV
ncbi:MAG: phosphoribosyltransferase family protein [Acidimicrobiales bacterium]|jgi:adenine phosphoribosyltransferase